jgi:hypothetical protein
MWATAPAAGTPSPSRTLLQDLHLPSLTGLKGTAPARGVNPPTHIANNVSGGTRPPGQERTMDQHLFYAYRACGDPAGTGEMTMS